jgi:hypothetical protein
MTDITTTEGCPHDQPEAQGIAQLDAVIRASKELS